MGLDNVVDVNLNVVFVIEQIIEYMVIVIDQYGCFVIGSIWVKGEVFDVWVNSVSFGLYCYGEDIFFLLIDFFVVIFNLVGGFIEWMVFWYNIQMWLF